MKMPSSDDNDNKSTDSASQMDMKDMDMEGMQ